MTLSPWAVTPFPWNLKDVHNKLNPQPFQTITTMTMLPMYKLLLKTNSAASLQLKMKAVKLPRDSNWIANVKFLKLSIIVVKVAAIKMNPRTYPLALHLLKMICPRWRNTNQLLPMILLYLKLVKPITASPTQWI